ncbi:MAG: 23S rRNA (adenine(2503)-C(2))-methyltransferase RlmN [Actinomycetia bacterium]|nr:23S rRNA (adenine(2503)-C(2))-methyltransferase RlmN [Actinomycetes bacterium]
MSIDESNTPDDSRVSHALPATVGIKRFGRDGLAALLSTLGQPAYRTDQLLEWLYGRQAKSFAEMTTLPSQLREFLDREQPLWTPLLRRCLVSADGSRKYLLELADGSLVECVGIPDEERLTVCFSTQVGCAMRCAFCASGRLGLQRQLAAGEMVDQINVVSADFDQRVTNAVAMGEGEPFANYKATLDALRLLNQPRILAIGARRLTVSTSGLIPGIRNFSGEPEQFRLAVSLPSARQSTRDQLMPGLSQQPLDHLWQTLYDYNEISGRRFSLEYCLIQGVNNTSTELAELLDFCAELNCHVNLISLNVVAGVPPPDWQPVPLAEAQRIEQQLNAAGVIATLRRSRGADIAGACGQLAGTAGLEEVPH